MSFLKPYLTRKLIYSAVSVGALAVGCVPASSTSKYVQQRNPAVSGLTGTDNSTNPTGSAYKVRPNVSAFTLDDGNFLVTGVGIGLASFMQSKSPVVNFFLPPQADYAEILRCSLDVTLPPGPTGVDLPDIEVSGRTSNQKIALYKATDYFGEAQTLPGCTLITDGTVTTNYFDSFAPTGSYVYLVRSCVNPIRLTDSKFLTSRNCSLQVAISAPLTSFTNTRRDKENADLKDAAIQASALDQVGTTMRALAEQANSALDTCNLTEQHRASSVKIKNSWAQLAATAIDVTLDLGLTAAMQAKKGASALLKHYTTPKPMNMLDLLNLVASAQGFNFATAFHDLVSSSNDMPRSCTRYLKLIDDMQTAQSKLAVPTLEYQHAMAMADVHHQGVLGADGQAISLPSNTSSSTDSSSSSTSSSKTEK